MLDQVEEEKDLGVWFTSEMSFRKQCAAAAKKANAVLSTIKRTISCFDADIIMPLYIALVRPRSIVCKCGVRILHPT